MSWDILVFNTKSTFELENGDKVPDFGSRQVIIDGINIALPESKWNDPSWGSIDNPNANIEFNVGNENRAVGNNFMLHVRGGKDPITEIIKMCHANNWIAYDISRERFIDNSSRDSFTDWQEYRDQVISKQVEKKPWWKLW